MNTALDLEEMTDEEFETAIPQETSEDSESTVESTSPDEEVVEDVDHTTPNQTKSHEEDDQPESAEEELVPSDEEIDDAPKPEVFQESSEDETDAVESSEEEETEDTQPEADKSEEPTDYKVEYDKIMAPFKANGREFKVENPGEAVQLMQLGANYTQKMQALKPNLKMMRMLENNNLLDEDKLAFLIDIDKKDPAAIHKLLHDSSIDPMDLDTSSEPTYRPKDHKVGDEEMSFHNVLTDVNNSLGGKETVSHINSEWDAVSKEAVYKEPAILAAINEQRGNGIYDLITTELNRQQTLGTLSPDIPFIHAYQKVGDQLNSQGRLTLGAETVPSNLSAPEVIETRTAPRKQTVANGEKARAASATKSSSKVTPKSFDPFSMTDEEIMAIPSPRG
jgi:hypothetical protein